MDRLSQLRGAAGGSRDCSLDSAPSEAYITANESSKYFSLSEEDSSFDITPIKDVSLSSAADPEKTITGNELISNLSPIQNKSDILDSYKIGKQIEAANILSGGVNIFDDNDNSYDGNELVIDDNVEIDDKSNELKLSENAEFQKPEEIPEATLADNETIASKDTEVVLQIDGRNVNAIDIGNGLYLYRKEGEEELAAVQIIDDNQQQPNFKFLKVRENAEGNLEVYEEIEIEVPKEVPAKEEKIIEKKAAHVPIKDISKVISDPICNKVVERKNKSPLKEISPSPSTSTVTESKEALKPAETRNEVSLNGKMTKINETRKSPVIHSTPNKEGVPLTKTMVDLQLHPNRHSDKVKTIEVHTDCKPKADATVKSKDADDLKIAEIETDQEKDAVSDKLDVTEDKDGEVKVPDTKLTEKDDKNLDKPRVPDEIWTQEAKVSTTNQILGNDIIETKELEKVDDKQENIVETPKDATSPSVSPKIQSVQMEPINKGECSSSKIDESLEKAKENSIIEAIEAEIQPLKETTPNKPTEQKHAGLEVAKSDVDDKLTNTDTEAIKVIDKIVENKTAPPEIINKKEFDESEVPKDIKPQNKEIDKATDVKSIENTCNSVKTCNKNILTDTVDGKESIIDRSQDISNVIEPTKVDEVGLKPKEDSQKDIKQCVSDKRDAQVSEQKAPIDMKPVEQVTSIKHIPVLIQKQDVTKKEVPNKDKNESVNVKNAIKIDKLPETIEKVTEDKPQVKKEIAKVNTNVDQKPVNNNHAAVPFGMWTEANRQEFLNKIKESKIPTSTSNTKQLKQPNDLNRRDVLQKIDSQRERHTNNAIAKAQELNAKLNVKNETKTFTNKPTSSKDSKVPVKTETAVSTDKPVVVKTITKPEVATNSIHPKDMPNTTFSSSSSTTKKEPLRRKEINNQDLIDKTIEGIINRALPPKESTEDAKPDGSKDTVTVQKETASFTIKYQTGEKDPTSLDAIEMKMNELHGIPFVERPPHELPHVPAMYKHDIKTYSKLDNPKPVNKASKITNAVPSTNKNPPKITKDVVEVDSEEEIIEHEPITGDIDINKKDIPLKVPSKLAVTETVVTKLNADTSKKPIITENDFDKFVRRNSITYENCLTVNFESNQPHNVIQTVVEKDVPVKKYSRNEILLAEAKTKSSHKMSRPNKHASKIQITSRLMPVSDDSYNKNYQSKLQMAYQSALTTKRQMESPITIIEDKPVKVVFMDSNAEYTPSQLNVQGAQLSPVKKQIPEPELFTVNDSMDSDILEVIDGGKAPEESKVKTKHQRKQVLTPVETPELELIDPSDLGLNVEALPKKKRRVEDKAEKSTTILTKKTYLLNRSAIVENKVPEFQDLTKNPLKETINPNNAVVSHQDAASAIDNLVKAAELIETQSETLNVSTATVSSDTSQATPVKRGRGRPRKYPLPETPQDATKPSSPQKKPRLIDAKKPVRDASTDEATDEDTSDEGIIKENWTMGKINENIVCPICSKLFRSENVVFKHVKHCTGPSPNRSDSDNRSPRRSRQSVESESKSRDSRFDDAEVDAEMPSSKNKPPKKRKSKELLPESVAKDDESSSSEKERDEPKQHVSRKSTAKTKILQRPTGNLECEFCGKTFRQLSYLVSHKLQHKKDDAKKTEDITNTSVFSCEVCKKEFRKLHHLAQHRLMHTMPSRPSRKSSSEQIDKKVAKDQDIAKQSDDRKSAFRCEPCDKSFRKLHHLVEHRETHDGINRQKNVTTAQASVDKPAPTEPPQCDICKKTFRKLHHLIDHKEQHVETSSEKSDDKSVKSSLSRDIIHECSLCYMVFPNEHSLNKHSVICQRKKRQSAAKQEKQPEETEAAEEGNETAKSDEILVVDEPDVPPVAKDKVELESNDQDNKVPEPEIVEKIAEIPKVIEKHPSNDVERPVEPKTLPVKRNVEETVDSGTNAVDTVPEIPAKVKKIEEKPKKEEPKVDITPKKKITLKDKPTSVTKRQKSINLPLPVVEEAKPVESSDDDEVRYMLNPDFKVMDTTEGKTFMKVRANKRNSLQIERPNSKDLVKRRTSLQHPPKIPRLKAKPVETRIASATALKNVVKPKLESVPSTDSDDSDIKYSFPKAAAVKTPKAQDSKAKEVKTPKERRKTLVDKRKSIGGIAKRKSAVKPVTAKHKAIISPTKPIKRRTTEAEHRCDCGQLFSSAAMLSRHTTLAHTPPRIRRRRSPPPEVPKTKPTRKSTSDKPKSTDSRKSSIKSDMSNSKSAKTAEKAVKSPTRKSIKVEAKSTVKATRTAAHRGVPVPEKMKKLFQKKK